MEHILNLFCTTDTRPKEIRKTRQSFLYPWQASFWNVSLLVDGFIKIVDTVSVHHYYALQFLSGRFVNYDPYHVNIFGR